MMPDVSQWTEKKPESCPKHNRRFQDTFHGSVCVDCFYEERGYYPSTFDEWEDPVFGFLRRLGVWLFGIRGG